MRVRRTVLLSSRGAPPRPKSLVNPGGLASNLLLSLRYPSPRNPISLYRPLPRLSSKTPVRQKEQLRPLSAQIKGRAPRPARVPRPGAHPHSPAQSTFHPVLRPLRPTNKKTYPKKTTRSRRRRAQHHKAQNPSPTMGQLDPPCVGNMNPLHPTLSGRSGGVGSRGRSLRGNGGRSEASSTGRAG